MTTPRGRVIIDNDFSGDPDDLFQLVHHVLSRSVEIPFVIGSHLSPGDALDPSDTQADNAARIAQETLALLGDAGDIPVVVGSNTALADRTTPIRSAAAEAIVAEALRDDTDLPLYVALGAGMTDLASAWLMEPRIGERLTAVWIGGSEHAGMGERPPGAGSVEYNLAIDVPAAQTVFADSDIPIWQFPRNAYRQCVVSVAELDHRVRPHGPVGAYLAESIDRTREHLEARGHRMGETYVLGDSPLVLVTALQNGFEADSASSEHVVIPTPRILDDGGYEATADGRPLRVYTKVDTRLMFEDMYAKLALHAAPPA